MLDDDDPFGSLGLAEIQLSDKSQFDSFFSTCRTRLSDYSFANTYIWREPIHLRWRLLEDCLCVFANGDGGLTLLFPPLGEGNVASATREALSICDDYNARAGLHGNTRIEYVSAEMLQRLDCPCDAQPMSGDYLYHTARMIDLAGGDLASKRQAKNRFLRRYDARTEELAPHHVQPCLDLLSRWQEQSHNLPEKIVHAVEFKRCKEIAATGETLAHAKEMGLRGLVLYAGDQLVGFTVGEMLADDTCSILIEKCDREFTGSAQFIFSEFCHQCWSHTTLCNVGDDWELPSLAWTKQSYRPIGRLEKWVVRPLRPATISFSTIAPAAAAIAEGLYVPRASQVTQAQSVPLQHVQPINTPSEQPASITPEMLGMTSASVTVPAADRANLSDLEDLLDLERRCFAKPVALSRRQMRYLLQSPTATVQVLRENGHVVAGALVLRRKTRNGVSGRLYSMAVHDSCRGRGLGRVLLESCLTTLRRENVPSVVLEVDVTNTAAIKLYEKAGFQRVRRIADYYGPGNDGWKMKLELQTVANSQ